MSASAESPTVSVVLTTYNRRDWLPETLTPVLCDPDALEVVVVVDGCRDGSWELLQAMARDDPRLRPVQPQHNLGQPRARLLGVEHARGDVVLSLDDDVIAGPGLVGGHRRHHAERPHAVVLGYMPVETPSPRRAGQFATFQYAVHYEEHCRRYEADAEQVLTNLWGGNFSVRRTDFLASVEGHDFPLRYHEDQDLGLRFRRLGLEPVFDRSLRATHRHERSFDSYVRDSRSAGVAAGMLPAMHPDVLPPYHPDDAIPHYSFPARLLVRWSDVAWARTVSLGVLRGAVAVAGRAAAFTLETKLATVAGHIAERQGALDAVSRGRRPPRPRGRAAPQGGRAARRHRLYRRAPRAR